MSSLPTSFKLFEAIILGALLLPIPPFPFVLVTPLLIVGDIPIGLKIFPF